jgi:hypothetical protein
VTEAIAANETRLQNLVALGIMGQDEATQSQAQFIRDQAGGIGMLVAALTTLRDASADPAVIAGINAIIAKFQGLQVQAASTLTQMQQFGAGALKAAASSVTQFFSESADGAHTFGEAMTDAVRSFVQAIATMITEILALMMVVKIAEALGVPKGIIAAAGIKRASGGMVPGTGGGDTVHALLTPGEFILSRSMVDAMGGLDVLERFRLALGSHGPVLRGGVPYFAGGGLVPAGMDAANLGALQESRVHITVEASTDLVVKQIESGPGSRAVVKAIQKNRNSANDALGRG